LKDNHIPPRRRLGAVGLAATVLCAAGVLAVATPSAPAEVVGPVLVLGPTSVVNGTAVVSGTLGDPNSGLELTINGQPVGLGAGGSFSAVVNVAGEGSLTFSVRNPTTGRVATTTIPLNTNIVGPGGVIGPGVLDGIKHAAVSLLEPVGGFRIIDGLPLRIEGTVADPTSLASLSVNGQDVLGTLSGGGFTVAVPGTTREITVRVVDRQGVSHTVTVPVIHQPSAPGGGTGATAPTGRSVAASAAVGVRIAKVRYITRNVRRTKRMRMVVTIRDRRGLLVRNATVRSWSRFAGRLRRNPRVKRTNKLGQTAFLLLPRNRAFGKRLVMVTVAKTPKASARKATSVRLPRRQKAATRR
jgi:hypothetical protein